jgi:hypothetical protein
MKELQDLPHLLPTVNCNATAAEMVQLRKDGAIFEPACKDLTKETLG